jgi:hypothetical protein
MAQIFPEDFHIENKEFRLSSEIGTLLRLKSELPDQYSVFHGIHWTRVEEDAAIYGEIDFLVVNQYGKILAIEQKETKIERSKTGDLLAIYESANGRRSEKSISSQVTRNIHSLRQEFSRRHSGKSIQIDHLLYLPTATITGPLPSSLAIGRVVDQSESINLPEIILKIFEDNPIPSGDNVADALSIRDFLSEKAFITPQLGLLGRSAKVLTTRLAGGLSEWAERLEFSPFNLWVQGTAGSGKTQLALKELKRAKSNNQTSMYLCFNRPLADAMKLVAPEPNNCMTFHELASLLSKQKGHEVDFEKNNAFQNLENFLLKNITDLVSQLDVLVVDEGQDFERQWGESLVTMVKEGGRIIWLEDPSQDLYKRWDTNWTGWVKLTSPINYRSPQRLVNLMNALQLTSDPLESGNGFAGMIPEIYTYEVGSVNEATECAVLDLLKEGYAPESIAVLSFRGMANSALLSGDVKTLADLKIKKFVGYDSKGSAIWSDGQLFVDTLFRFKGQCADAVILTEIDFDEWTDDIKKRLFVGLSRARLMASMVVTERAGELLDQKLQN